MVAAPGQEIASPRGQDQSRLNPGASLKCDIRIPSDLLLLRILKCSKGMKDKVRPRDKPRRTPQSATPSTRPVMAQAAQR